MLKCPYCAKEFHLTWKRYFRAPFSIHRCPQCKRLSRLSFEPAVLIRMVLVILISGGLGLLAAIWLFGPGPLIALIGFIAAALAVSLPVDKYHDSYYRELKKFGRDK